MVAASRLDIRSEHIADSAHGFDDAAPLALNIQLLTQTTDLNVHAAISRTHGHAVACEFQQPFARQRPLRMVEENGQQVILRA